MTPFWISRVLFSSLRPYGISQKQGGITPSVSFWGYMHGYDRFVLQIVTNILAILCAMNLMFNVEFISTPIFKI